jgi:hypothetical protein
LFAWLIYTGGDEHRLAISITTDPGLELAFYVIGVPIAVVNMWEWFKPEVIKQLLLKE